MMAETGRSANASKPSAQPHLTPAERIARGKAARAEVRAPVMPSSSPCRTAPTRSSCSNARRGRVSPSLCRSVTAGCWSRRSRSIAGPRMIMAQRPGRDAALRPDRAVLRRRAPVELRRVRLARAAPRFRPQRFRRDAARAVGVGRQAAGGEHVDRRARQRLRRKDAGPVVLDTVEAYRTAMRNFAAMNNLDVWYAHLDIESALGRLAAAAHAELRQADREGSSPRPAPRDSMSASAS